MLRFAALWVLVRVFGHLPTPVIYAAGGAVGHLAWYLRPSLRRITRDHMRQVFGPEASDQDVSRAAHGCVLSASYYWADLARYAHIPVERTFDFVDEIEGVPELYDAVGRGCGLVLVSAHLGNAEFITQAIGSFEFRTLVFTEPLSPPRLHRFVEGLRRRSGVDFVPADLSGVRLALKRLRSGEVAAALADRDVLGNGRMCEFFGRPARMPTGAAELARRTGAPVVFATILRTRPGRYSIRLRELALPAATGDRDADQLSAMRTIITAIEDEIRAAPEQWFVLTPVWSRP